MGFTMKIMSFYHENHGFGWTSSSRGVNFQAQGPGSRIALVGHSMGGRIAMQSGPWCLTHFQVKTCYMGCDQKSHIDHIGNLDKHHCQTFDAQYLNISSGIFEMVWCFFFFVQIQRIRGYILWPSFRAGFGAQVRSRLSGRSELAGDRGYGDPSKWRKSCPWPNSKMSLTIRIWWQRKLSLHQWEDGLTDSTFDGRKKSAIHWLGNRPRTAFRGAIQCWRERSWRTASTFPGSFNPRTFGCEIFWNQKLTSGLLMVGFEQQEMAVESATLRTPQKIMTTKWSLTVLLDGNTCGFHLWAWGISYNMAKTW